MTRTSAETSSANKNEGDGLFSIKESKLLSNTDDVSSSRAQEGHATHPKLLFV